MSRFPSDKHIASWAGMCPGNNESAGKRKSGRITKGSPWLKEALVEASQAAGRAKGTYLYALFHRIAARRGKKRAAIAVGHAILVIVYHMLKTRSHYQELGQDYFDRLNRDAVSRLVKRWNYSDTRWNSRINSRISELHDSVGAIFGGTPECMPIPV